MKLIEADKVEQAIKDYWKAQVDKVPVPKSIKEHCEYTNHLDAIEKHNYNILKIINELSSAQSEFRTAYWTKDAVGSIVCSKCGGIRKDNRIGHINFCNCCGAKMRGKQDANNF